MTPEIHPVNDSDLVAELRAALKDADEHKAAYDEARRGAIELKADWQEKLKLVAEIENEIRHGKTGRELIDKVGTVHTSEPVTGNGIANAADAKATFQAAALDDLLHASGTEDRIRGDRKTRKVKAS